MNTAKAGAGALAVTIDGPSKVQLSCYETPDGYEFMYTPTQPGEYHVNVKYAGNTHIPGSPFKVDIEGKGRRSICVTSKLLIIMAIVIIFITIASVFIETKNMHKGEGHQQGRKPRIPERVPIAWKLTY